MPDGTVQLIEEGNDVILVSINFSGSADNRDAHYAIAKAMIAAGMDCAQDLMDAGQIALPAVFQTPTGTIH
ncbi:MAG: hypothetical protein GY814_12995 [Gammaproteobacteria bacterium]|nr:hypothetical protein [Gammaproteobacteria bacterium]